MHQQPIELRVKNLTTNLLHTPTKRIAHMAPQMQGLAKYIKEAYSPEITTDICPFDTKAGDPGPLLRPKGINRILLYPGSFNPPHKGHLNLLSYVLHNAGQDLQITSAFIILTDNDSLVEKTRNEDRPLILDRKERIDLWRKSGLSTDRVWLFDRTENEWTEFRKRLEDNLQRDDIELKFILLGGPDWIRLECTHDPSYWGCRDSITSDVSRPVNFRYPGNLRQLSGCSMWEGLECDVNRIRRQLQARLRGRSARGSCSSPLCHRFDELTHTSLGLNIRIIDINRNRGGGRPGSETDCSSLGLPPVSQATGQRAICSRRSRQAASRGTELNQASPSNFRLSR